MIDHLVYATPEVDSTVSELADRLGVRAVPGGQHPGRGTRNALIGLGPRCYLEIVGPDAGQPPPPQPRWFLIDELSAPRLVAWAASDADFEARAASPGLGPIVSGSRRLPNGQMLAWRFTDPAVRVAGGVMPFFIDWGEGPHPADLLAPGIRLVELRLEHPDPAPLNAVLGKLGVTVRAGPAPKLTAILETSRGLLDLY